MDESGEADLAAKLAFLGRPAAYSPCPAEVDMCETHMSWVFLAGDHVYKLKKPVRFPYLDFSTLTRREQACRAEVRLNRRLAPDVYLDVLPLAVRDGGLAIGAEGRVVDWLVCMRRLDEACMLDRRIVDGRLAPRQISRLAGRLAAFYRTAPAVLWSTDSHLLELHRTRAYNRRVLLDRRFGLPAGMIRRIDAAQRTFLREHGGAIVARCRRRRIVDGHGDLRPEHISLDDRVRVIDCLEFDARLRAVDPFDEIAYLAMECERLGAAWAGAALRRQMQRLLRDGPVDALFDFYRCYRATLRARLAIAHLYEAHPRTPEKWPALARAYLGLAEESARRLEAWFRTPAGRPGCARRKDGGSPRRAMARSAIR